MVELIPFFAFLLIAGTWALVNGLRSSGQKEEAEAS